MGRCWDAMKKVLKKRPCHPKKPHRLKRISVALVAEPRRGHGRHRHRKDHPMTLTVNLGQNVNLVIDGHSATNGAVIPDGSTVACDTTVPAVATVAATVPVPVGGAQTLTTPVTVLTAGTTDVQVTVTTPTGGSFQASATLVVNPAALASISATLVAA